MKTVDFYRFIFSFSFWIFPSPPLPPPSHHVQNKSHTHSLTVIRNIQKKKNNEMKIIYWIHHKNTNHHDHNHHFYVIQYHLHPSPSKRTNKYAPTHLPTHHTNTYSRARTQIDRSVCLALVVWDCIRKVHNKVAFQ